MRGEWDRVFPEWPIRCSARAGEFDPNVHSRWPLSEEDTLGKSREKEVGAHEPLHPDEFAVILEQYTASRCPAVSRESRRKGCPALAPEPVGTVDGIVTFAPTGDFLSESHQIPPGILLDCDGKY
jgi:hypothetical protein